MITTNEAKPPPCYIKHCNKPVIAEMSFRACPPRAEFPQNYFMCKDHKEELEQMLGITLPF